MSISVSPDGHFLTGSDGSPFFWLADTAWQIFNRLDEDDADHYFRIRAAQGYTVIQAVATGRVYGDWLTAPNRAGHPPFVDADPLRPHPGYMDHVGRLIDLARDHGLRIALLPIWSLAGIAVPEDQRVLDAWTARAYGRAMAERFADRDVIWVLGGDVTPIWFGDYSFASDAGEVVFAGDLNPVDYRPVFDELAGGIRDVLGDDAFLTYHPTGLSPLGAPPPRTSLFFGDRDWLDMNMLQSSHFDYPDPDEDGGREVSDRPGYHWSGPYNYLPVNAEYRSRPTRPIVDGEPRYEDHPSGRGIWSALDARNAAYHALFAGAAGHTYGHVSVWDFHVPGDEVTSYFAGSMERDHWRDGLRAAGGTQMRHAKDLLLSRPYFTRIPDDDALLGDRRGGSAHLSATRDADRSFLMAYTPYGESVRVRPDALPGEGDVIAWWFDPRVGAATRTEPSAVFTPPTRGEDWVLVLDDPRRGFPPPGSLR